MMISCNLLDITWDIIGHNFVSRLKFYHTKLSYLKSCDNFKIWLILRTDYFMVQFRFNQTKNRKKEKRNKIFKSKLKGFLCLWEMKPLCWQEEEILAWNRVIEWKALKCEMWYKTKCLWENWRKLRFFRNINFIREITEVS